MNFILLALGIALILGTGFFVAVEFSLVALETATVYQEREKGDTRANAVLQCLRTLSTQLSKLPNWHYDHDSAHGVHTRRFH